MNSETSAAGLLRELDLEDQAEGREPATGWKKNPAQVGQHGPISLTARVPSEARRGGLARATILGVGDGAAWIWHLMSARWGGAHQWLDLYTAGQHLHAPGERRD